MNSTNGTYLLEKKEKRKVDDVGELIQNGDVMRIGETDLVITVYED